MLFQDLEKHTSRSHPDAKDLKHALGKERKKERKKNKHEYK